MNLLRLKRLRCSYWELNYYYSYKRYVLNNLIVNWELKTHWYRVYVAWTLSWNWIISNNWTNWNGITGWNWADSKWYFTWTIQGANGISTNSNSNTGNAGANVSLSWTGKNSKTAGVKSWAQWTTTWLFMMDVDYMKNLEVLGVIIKNIPVWAWQPTWWVDAYDTQNSAWSWSTGWVLCVLSKTNSFTWKLQANWWNWGVWSYWSNYNTWWCGWLWGTWGCILFAASNNTTITTEVNWGIGWTGHWWNTNYTWPNWDVGVVYKYLI